MDGWGTGSCTAVKDTYLLLQLFLARGHVPASGSLLFVSASSPVVRDVGARFPNLAKELTQMYGALRSVNPLLGTDRWFILRFLHTRSTHSTVADIGLSRNPARRFCRKLRIA
jgi:hypothetical protein